MGEISPLRVSTTQGGVTPWYLDEEMTQGYEGWYEGKYKKADSEEKALLAAGLEWIGGVGSLLEFGCGTAHFTRWFEANGVEAYGADISPPMLREARRLWPGGNLVLGTSVRMPVREKSVDAVAFVTCFEYMPDPVGVVREALRVSRKGIIFGLMNAWSAPTIRRKIQILLGKNPFYKTAHFYSLREITGIIRDAVGEGRYATSQKSGVFPSFIPLKQSRMPFGAFLCVSVRFPGGGQSQ